MIHCTQSPLARSLGGMWRWPVTAWGEPRKKEGRMLAYACPCVSPRELHVREGAVGLCFVAGVQKTGSPRARRCRDRSTAPRTTARRPPRGAGTHPQSPSVGCAEPTPCASPPPSPQETERARMGAHVKQLGFARPGAIVVLPGGSLDKVTPWGIVTCVSCSTDSTHATLQEVSLLRPAERQTLLTRLLCGA